MLLCLSNKNASQKLTWKKGAYLSSYVFLTGFFYFKETPLSTSLQQNFLDYLLSTYRTLERSFMRSLYELHKAFVFRTLWEGNNPLSSFQRVSSESARGTARLNGAVELTSVLQKMKRDQDKAVNCFTNIIYATGIKKWSFDSTKNKKVC